MKRQATKDSPSQVELHIKRQRHLGERMIGESDQPRLWDVLGTIGIVALIFVGTLRGWW